MADQQKEIRAARAAAQEALRLLEEVERTLKGARNWGFFDLVAKRSALSSLVKFGKISKAEDRLRQVQAALRRLQKELGDINISIRESLKIGSFQAFMDIAFDNIISDWLTQSRIHDTLREVAYVKGEVQQVLLRLGQRQR